MWAPEAAETHVLHDDPRAARRGSAEEQTGGGPKARTEGEREEEEGGRVRKKGRRHVGEHFTIWIFYERVIRVL